MNAKRTKINSNARLTKQSHAYLWDKNHAEEKWDCSSKHDMPKEVKHCWLQVDMPTTAETAGEGCLWWRITFCNKMLDQMHFWPMSHNRMSQQQKYLISQYLHKQAPCLIASCLAERDRSGKDKTIPNLCTLCRTKKKHHLKMIVSKMH